jgi:hypothetical protein
MAKVNSLQVQILSAVNQDTELPIEIGQRRYVRLDDFVDSKIQNGVVACEVRQLFYRSL